MTKRPGHRGMLLLLAVTLAIKLLAVWQLKDHPLLQPDAGLDTTAYVSLARQVLAGNVTLGPGLYYVAPFYIYFVAAILGVFDSFTAVRIVQVLLGTAAAGGIAFMARRWFSPRAGWSAGVLAASTGLFTFYEAILLQSSLDAFFVSAALAALTWHLTTVNGPAVATSAVLSGVAFGAGALNRPNLLVAFAGVAVAALIVRRWRTALLLMAGCTIAIVPVLARNIAVAAEPTLISSHGGLNFYIGNHEGATGFYQEVPGVRPLIEGQQEDTRRVASRAIGRDVSDAEASAYFRRQATDWMRAHPLDAIWLLLRKLYFAFHAQHVALPHSYPFYAEGTILRVLPVGPSLLAPLGLVGLVLAARARSAARNDFLIWAAFVPGYAAAVALFFLAERYRLGLLVPLCVTAGGAIDITWSQLSSRRRRTLLPAAVSFAVLLVLCNWPMPFLNDGHWDEGLRLAQRLVITGDYIAADALVDRLEREAPRPGRAHHGVGMQLVVQDQPERALPHLRRALDLGFLSADDPEVWLRLGRLSARTKGPAEAEPFFRRAAALAPQQAGARQQYGLNLLLLGRIENAATELTEAVRLDPRDPDSLAHLAYCEIKLRRLDAARQHVRDALALAPDHDVARQLAAALGG